ncbi:MAG TPA: hypothetical protein VMM76_01135 [Pirellulaceae bacterium]|nr:hypothetical protein [Pirellulaceae bacterium]
MFRSIITLTIFSIGIAVASPEVFGQISFSYGGNSGGHGHGGYRSYGGRSSGGYQTYGGNQSHGNQGMSWSIGGGNGSFSMGVGSNGIQLGSSTGPKPPTWTYPSNRQQTWTYPQPQARPSTKPNIIPQPQRIPTKPQQTAQVRPNVIPQTPTLPPAAINPHANAIDLCGRPITPEEMERAKKFFEERLLELIDRLAQRIPTAECDENAVLQLMTRHGVPGNVQIQIFDCLKAGDWETAEQLWRKALPKCEVPFRSCPAHEYVQRFRIAIRQRRPAGGELKQLISCLPAGILQENSCCSANNLVAQLQEEAGISDAIAAVPSTPVVPVNFQRSSGKSQQFGLAGQASPLPTGVVNIVYHPKLPDGATVVVNSKLVMIGTGGRGAFRMETGYVAEALGQHIETAAPVPAREAELVRSGILLLNPTGATINFLVDNRELSLAAGFQQTLNTDRSVTVSFDTGTRRTARYTLSPGTYRFKIADGALDLMRGEFQVSIDNRENATPFQYIVQGEHATAEPGEMNTHPSDYPIVIRYDRGNGAETKQLLCEQKDGTLYAAVNAVDHLWDLFDADTVPTEALPSNTMPIAQQESNYIPAF